MLCVATGAMQDEEFEMDEAPLDLALPSFPAPPKRDIKLLHLKGEIDSNHHDHWATEYDMDFDASASPRFLSNEFESDEDATEDEGEEENEEQGFEEEGDEGQESEEEETVQPANFRVPTPGAPLAPQARFMTAVQRRGLSPRDMHGSSESGIFPPPPPLAPAFDLAQSAGLSTIPPNSMEDALFLPVASRTPAFPPGPAAPSLAANPQAYAYATAAPAFVEQQADAAMGLLRPYDPSSVPSSVPARSSEADLAQAEYQTYSQANWPQHVSPPASYYLPPDVVV